MGVLSDAGSAGFPIFTAHLALSTDRGVSFKDNVLLTFLSSAKGMPPLPTRLMAGLAILKHTFELSDEELCARWTENPHIRLGRTIRDVARGIAGEDDLKAIFLRPLHLASRVLEQDRHQRGGARSTVSTRRKWSASARARRIRHTSSA